MGMFKKAERKKAKLRLAISGPSGSGKTYSALLIASGIVPLDKVAVIDTEAGSADLYASLGGYSTLTLDPPYEPGKYIEALKAAENEGFELVIIDSLSHAWSGEGGLLDMQGKAASTKYRGNSWAAWREITPEYNKLVETILHSPAHVIVTMRSKTEYVQSDEGGRKKIEKVGTAPIQRDGIEYEFTTVFDMSQNHTATVSKDRTKIFDGKYFTPDKSTGMELMKWLDSGISTKDALLERLKEEGIAPDDMAYATYKCPMEELSEAQAEVALREFGRAKAAYEKYKESEKEEIPI